MWKAQKNTSIQKIVRKNLKERKFENKNDMGPKIKSSQMLILI